MRSSSQYFLSAPVEPVPPGPGLFRSLSCVALVSATILLGTSSSRPPLPETLVFSTAETLDVNIDALESMRRGGKELFTQRLETRLPKYTGLIHRAAAEHDIDWQLLAAMSYQESFWDPDATSPTGVRGLMMLTQVTASELKVNNRLDPRQSILGGAEYFARLRARLPASIQEPDRTSMALAAYNMGMSHLEDARILTEHYGKNPDRWDDVVQFIPLLEQKEYYAALRNGYARGREAVRYVQRIREYQIVIAWHQQQRSQPFYASASPPDMRPASTLQSSSWPQPSNL